MTERPARYLDGATSTAVPVRVRLAPVGRLQVEGPGLSLSLDLSDVTVRPRLGDTPRAIDLPGGARLEVDDNDAVDAALMATGQGRLHALVHALERHWHSVAVAVVVTLVAGWAVVAKGVPLMAERVARVLPAQVAETVSVQALDAMDRVAFAPSGLPDAERLRLEALFGRVVPPGGEHAYRLLFRAAPTVGPNAFALPDGTVVVTDELVELAESDHELLAVLAHEVGHVVHRHALRQVLQNSTAALLIAVVTGDIVSTSTLAAGLPVALLQAHYSRAFETEADTHALEWMRAEGLPPEAFATLMARMDDGAGEAVPGFLSTHPPTPERIARFRTEAP